MCEGKILFNFLFRNFAFFSPFKFFSACRREYEGGSREHDGSPCLIAKGTDPIMAIVI